MPYHPAVRARHGKRLPVDDESLLARDGFSLTGPTQITVIQTIPPATSSAISSSSSVVTTSSTTSSLASSTTSTLASSTFTPPTTIASPIASAIGPKTTPSGTETEQVNTGVSVPSQHGLPTGAIVGITIVAVMLILGAFVFFIRQRAVRNRKLNRQTAPWLGAPNNSYNGMAESSPGASFARAQQAALSRPAVPAPLPVPVPPPSSVPVVAVTAGAPTNATVRYEFIPSLPDELSITTGDIVSVVSEFDDGWALCKNVRGEQGMVPLECLDRSTTPAQEIQQEYRNSRRTSSLQQVY